MWRRRLLVMSVFKGRITEFPGVIIDHFSASNCKYGRAFFLSHCHKGAVAGSPWHNSRSCTRYIRSHDWLVIRGTGHNAEGKVRTADFT